jgi:retron-type reverse transcriptase
MGGPDVPRKAPFDIDGLARRLRVDAAELAAVRPQYRSFTIPKRSGRGRRRILAPSPELKRLQRRILRLLLVGYDTHLRVTGFEPKKSIVTNAFEHFGSSVVIRFDIKDFFESVPAERVLDFFHRMGRCTDDAAQRLTELCTYQGHLPQGAPTSPRLASLVVYSLDARLYDVAVAWGANYTRYADDLTFSLRMDDPRKVRSLVRVVKSVVVDEGFRVNNRKLRILRKHQRQEITGLVINETVNVPRRKRRWLRAVEHHVATGRPASLSQEQLDGWRQFMRMVETQRVLYLEEHRRKEEQRRRQEERRRRHEAAKRAERKRRKSGDDSPQKCFLATASACAVGRPEDCRDLRVLHGFCNGYVREHPERSTKLKRYYALAPRIVKAIDNRPNAKIEYERVYDSFVRAVVELIDAGENERAFDRCVSQVEQLARRFLG